MNKSKKLTQAQRVVLEVLAIGGKIRFNTFAGTRTLYDANGKYAGKVSAATCNALRKLGWIVEIEKDGGSVFSVDYTITDTGRAALAVQS